MSKDTKKARETVSISQSTVAVKNIMVIPCTSSKSLNVCSKLYARNAKCLTFLENGGGQRGSQEIF